MFKYYFSNYREIPALAGFSLFGATHILWLIFAAAFCACLCFAYKRSGSIRRKKIRRLIASVMLGMEILKDLILVLTGYFSLEYLPLHLCGMAIFISFFQAFFKNTFLDELLYSLCMPGALIALVFCNWTAYPFMNYMHQHSFIIHILLVAYTMMQLISGEIRPRIKNLYKSALFLAVVALPVHWLNVAANMNYLFIEAPSSGSPLMALADIFGAKLYFPAYICLVIAVWTLMYIPWEIYYATSGKRRKRKSGSFRNNNQSNIIM